MSYYGSWKIDDLLTFCANTHRFDTGAATDADAAPSYRVYEDETGTPILTGTMALLDSSNTAGFYSEQITLSAANGFEKGKCYSVYISATVNSVVGTTHHNFQIEAEVDANVVSDKTSYALTSGERDSVADALLARNVAGGSSTGRLVKEALYVLRNRTARSSGTLTVYGTDDSTTAFTATVTTSSGDPITEIDPS